MLLVCSALCTWSALLPILALVLIVTLLVCFDVSAVDLRFILLAHVCFTCCVCV
jgi:hypothetical protein